MGKKQKRDTMNLQTHKLNLIEGVLGVNDVEILSRVDTFLKTEIAKAHETEVVPITMKKYHDMIDCSLEDVRNGKIIEHEELKKEIRQWAEK